MKKVSTFIAALVLAILSLGVSASASQQAEHSDKTLSPYFFVKSDEPDVDRLPLKSTSAKVDVAGVIADVKVTQVYKNEGNRPIEAIYVFPGSTRAAVYAMKMTVGERVLVAEVRERKEARKIYEDAKNAGKSASLLEQQRPNVFQMNVANILPGDVITVELSYTELLVPTDKVYEFVYPTVVGPRYSNQPAATAPASEHWIQNPYLHQGEAPTYTFDMEVNLNTGLPVSDVYSSTHKVNVRFDGPSNATVGLDKSEKYGGNRDYILNYRLAGKQIQSGLLLYEGDEENFFLLMVQPPERVTSSDIPGREYIFIVDVSGSMHGFPLDVSKKLLKDLIGNLRPSDTFNVLLFAGSASVMSERSLPATAQNINKAITHIERQRGGGGTNLLPALKRALALPRTEGVSRTVVIATDGYVSVEEEAFELIRKSLGEANMFPFGIGSSVNRFLIEGMARVGMGEPFVVTKPDEAAEKANSFRKLIQSPVLTNIELDFSGLDVYDVEPLGVPDVLADRPVVVFGKWRGKPKGNITLSGVTGDRRYSESIRVSTIKPNEENSALRYLWARHRIATLADYNKLRTTDERVKEVTSLGLTYNLLTAYTSFVAVDTEVRMVDGKSVTVKQPLPLPQGVSDLAVGGATTEAEASSFSYNRKAIVKSAPVTPSSGYYRSDRDALAWLREPAEKPDDAKEELRARVRKVKVKGALANMSVRQIAESRAGELGACKAKGKVVVKLLIGADGSVSNAELVPKGAFKAQAEKCLLKIIKAWRFQPSQGGKTTEATITFIL